MRYETKIFYKFTATNGRPSNGRSRMRWPLPVEDERGIATPGNWRSVRGELRPCISGLHVATPKQLIHWIGRELYAIEVCLGTFFDGTPMIVAHETTKWVARRARLVRRIHTWDDAARARFDATCFRAALPAATLALTGREGVEHPYLELGRRLLQFLETDDGKSLAMPAISEIMETYRHTYELPPEIVPYFHNRQRTKLNARHFGELIVSVCRVKEGIGYTSAYSPYLRFLRNIRAIHRMTYEQVSAITDASIQQFFPDLIARDEAAYAARVAA